MNQLPGGGMRDNQQLQPIDALDQAFQISNYLRCGVDKKTLAVMINLVQNGVKPEHVATIVSEIKRAPM